jgi:hypothetical protein
LEEKLSHKIKCEKCSLSFSPMLIPTPFFNKIDPDLDGCSSCSNIKCGFNLDDFDPEDIFTFFKEIEEKSFSFESNSI